MKGDFDGKGGKGTGEEWDVPLAVPLAAPDSSGSRKPLEMSDIEEPQIKQRIYIPSSRYISHGRDDIAGGLATITEVKEGGSACNWFVSIAEVPGVSYNYEILMELQAELKKEFGEQRAHRDADWSPDSNPQNNGWDDPTEWV